MHFISYHNERGNILLITVAGLGVFLVLMALVIDVTCCFVVRNQLRNLADNAAVAAMGVYIDALSNSKTRDEALTDSINVAKEIASQTETLDLPGTAFSINDNDVIFGVFDQNTQVFTEGLDPHDPTTNIDAIRVNVRKDGVENLRYKFYLQSLTKFSDANVFASATSSLVRKNILFIMDISSSMDDNTYPKVSSAVRQTKPNDSGFEYYDFKTYPVSAYAYSAELLGGRPQPIYDLLGIISNFFGVTLAGVLDQNDNVGFMTYNLLVQDRVDQVSSGNSFVKPTELGNLANMCQVSMNFYDSYISYTMNSIPNSVFDYNPALFRSSLYVFEPYEITNPSITSIVDYKYTVGPYPNGSPMQQLEHDDSIIFPGGRYPSGENTRRDPTDPYIRSSLGDIPVEGYTNMGGALLAARNAFSVITSSGVPAFNMVILLSDGLPNVWRDGTYRSSTWYGRTHAREQADYLKADGVRICTIFYRTRGADGESFLETHIASESEYAFSTDDPNMVNTILNQIMQTFPYVLVE